MIQFQVPDATCGHCKSTIESAISELDDVTRAELDLSSKRLTIEHGNAVGGGEVKAAIENAGYTAEPVG
jgi:copper chaperone